MDSFPNQPRPLMICPDFDRVGGYERQAFFMTRSFRRRGIHTLLVSNRLPGTRPREERDGVVIHRLQPLPRPFSWPSIENAMQLFLGNHATEFDVIHAHAFTFLSARCVRIARTLGKPIVVKIATERDVDEFHASRSWSMRRSYRWLVQADRLVCISKAIQREILQRGIPEERVALCPNGVDATTFAPAPGREREKARAAIGVDRAKTVFSFCGRLVGRKAVDVLLRAFARARLQQAECVILGDGDERRELERLAVDLGIRERVRFLGERGDVQTVLHATDVFVFPSRLEGLPNAVLEAMATGLPVIASRIGGNVDLVDAGTGLLFDPDDIDRLAGHLRLLATHRELREKLGAAGRRRILDRFDFAPVTDRLLGIYGELVSMRNRRPRARAIRG